MSTSLPASPKGEPSTPAGREPCLVRAVAEALAGEPALEAVTIHRVERTVSLATLGRVDAPALEQRLRETLEGGCAPGSAGACQLLPGTPDCEPCTVADAAACAANQAATRSDAVARRRAGASADASPSPGDSSPAGLTPTSRRARPV